MGLHSPLSNDRSWILVNIPTIPFAIDRYIHCGAINHRIYGSIRLDVTAYFGFGPSLSSTHAANLRRRPATEGPEREGNGLELGRSIARPTSTIYRWRVNKWSQFSKKKQKKNKWESNYNPNTHVSDPDTSNRAYLGLVETHCNVPTTRTRSESANKSTSQAMHRTYSASPSALHKYRPCSRLLGGL